MENSRHFVKTNPTSPQNDMLIDSQKLKKLLEIIETKNSWGKNELKETIYKVALGLE